MIRVPSFTLPVALFMIAFVSLNIIRIHNVQKDSLRTLEHLDFKQRYEQQRQTLFLKSNPNSQPNDPQYSRQVFVLDGLYNLSHLVLTGALNTRLIDNNQTQILRKILQNCEVSIELPEVFSSYLKSLPAWGEEDGLLALFAALKISPEEQLKLLSCVRLNSPLSKVNLYFSNPETLAIVLNISPFDGEVTYQKIQNGEIDTIRKLRVYLETTFSKKITISEIQNLTISPQYDNAGVYWMADDKTFAYVDTSRTPDGTWKKGWDIILWIPKDFM